MIKYPFFRCLKAKTNNKHIKWAEYNGNASAESTAANQASYETKAYKKKGSYRLR